MAENMNYIVTLFKDGETVESFSRCNPSKMASSNPYDGESFKIDILDAVKGTDFICKEENDNQDLEIDDETRTSWSFRSKKMGNFIVVIEDQSGKYAPIKVRLDFYTVSEDTGAHITPERLLVSAKEEVDRIKSNISTSEGLIKVTDKATNEIKAIIKPSLGNDIPLIQLPKSYVDEFKCGDLEVDTTLFAAYNFEHAYIGNVSSKNYPEYTAEVDRLIDLDKQERGTTRLEYCFSIKTKIGSATYNFFYDSVSKDLICIQGLDTWLDPKVKIATVINRSEVFYVNATLYRVGRPHPKDLKEKDYSPAELITRTAQDRSLAISANLNEDVADLKQLLVDNNQELSAHLMTISSSAMYEGRNSSYQQAIVEEGGLKVLKANTPVILCVNLGKQSALTKSTDEDQIPNYILMQNNDFNNYYIHSNVNACNTESNFAIFLSLY